MNKNMNTNNHYPQGQDFRHVLNARYRVATIWQTLFLSALLIAIISLMALIYNVVDGAFGYIAYEYKNDPAAHLLDERGCLERRAAFAA